MVGRNVTAGLSVMMCLKKTPHPRTGELFSLKYNKIKFASNMDKNLTSLAEAKPGVGLTIKIQQCLMYSRQD